MTRRPRQPWCRPAASLAKRCWPEADLRFGRTGGLELLLRLGLARARLRSLKVEVRQMEAPGLLGYLAARLDFSALEVLEIRTPGGYVLSSAQNLATVDVSGTGPANQKDYGLALVLAGLSAAEQSSMRVLWKSLASTLAGILHCSPLLGLLDCNLDAAADLHSLKLLPNLRCLTLRLYHLWDKYDSDCADPTEDLHDAVSRLSQLEEIAIDMSHPNKCSHVEIRLRFSSQSLRLLDLRGMQKDCEVSFLACPALKELHTFWRGYFGCGIRPLAREGTGLLVIRQPGPLPRACYAFGAQGHWQNATKDFSSAQLVQIPDMCRVVVHPDGHRGDLPAVFGHQVSDEGSRSWEMLAVGAFRDMPEARFPMSQE
ncbi:hypothetical protein T492DRAFT_446886 [Pavlovales sp. CCMP2436]|nr:hypothetical protein T492DRAFT_446886 [Pavlovales sp. CCMP2436]|mmetsp:Transcript_9894/g.23061  ORF Transcript_9894/g.23061 Transcript_9894/m.23061 type:complete len:371 (+) Transcript_9894:520-1632(+)